MTDTDILLIRYPQFLRMIGVSRNGAALLERRDPTFPKKIKTGASRQAACFVEASAVREWVRQQVEKAHSSSAAPSELLRED